MKLYLVRHGESLSSDVDPEQPLSQRGKEETLAVAHHLQKLEIDEILHSVKLRAKQTAEILRETLCPEVALIEQEGLKPMDPIEPILTEIQSYDRNVMLVGHLPFMEKLFSTLCKEAPPISFCGSCIVCLEGEGRNWTLTWVATPESVST